MRFSDTSLKLIEEKLKTLMEASKKTDIKKSLYYADNYNLKLTLEKDDSHTFKVANETFKCK